MTEELKVIIGAEIAELRKNLETAKKTLKDFSAKAKENLSKVNDALKDVGEKSTAFLKNVGVAVTGAATALLALSETTKEYRTAQEKLNTAFESAGGSAEQAATTYNDLYRVLGDGDVAVEAANHLAKLTTNQSDLAEWTTICQGVYATFGDSLPIEGLAEAANETAKTGALTGGLADALNWAGASEEAFQAKLDACSTEAEREALIRETLNGLYSEAAANYEANAAGLLAANEAQAKLDASMATLGETMEPIMTLLKELGATVLAELTPYLQEFAEKHLPSIKEALSGVGDKVGEVFKWISDNWNTISTIGAILLTTAAAISVTSAAVGALNAVMALNPITLVVVAIAALVAAFVVLWNKCDAFRDFWKKLWDDTKRVFSKFADDLKPLWEAITGTFKEAWELIKVVWDLVKPYFETLWNNIKIVFSVVKDVLGGYFKAAWENIKIVWDVVVKYFTAVWNSIKQIFSVVKNVLTGNFRDAWTGIKNIFSTWSSFFTSLWDSVKKIFSNVGQAIGNAISSTVKGAVNAVLSTAVGIINGFISAINLAIGIINGIPGVNISRLSKLSVPKMAKGGIVDSATLALIGEQGKEAVVPLENNLEWIDKMATMLSNKLGGGNVPIVLNVDGKVFAETSISTINSLTRQTGRLALNLV